MIIRRSQTVDKVQGLRPGFCPFKHERNGIKLRLSSSFLV